MSPSRNGSSREVTKADEMHHALERQDRRYGFDEPEEVFDIDIDGPSVTEKPKPSPKKETKKKTPVGSTETIETLKAVILCDETGKPDPWRLQSRLISAFGIEAGIVCSRFFFWTGLSTRHKAGWFSQTREEMIRDTGITSHAKLQKARAILRGDREFAGKSWPGLLEEERPADPRAPTLYKIRMRALGKALGIDMPPPSRKRGKR